MNEERHVLILTVIDMNYNLMKAVGVAVVNLISI